MHECVFLSFWVYSHIHIHIHVRVHVHVHIHSINAIIQPASQIGVLVLGLCGVWWCGHCCVVVCDRIRISTFVLVFALAFTLTFTVVE